MNWRKMKLSWTTASEAISRNSVHMYFNNYVFTSGNRTSGSRSTSDLVYTWADSVCIHQLVLKQGCLYSVGNSLWPVPINAQQLTG